MRLTIKLITVGITLSLLLVSCNMPRATPDAAATIQAVYTSQAQTAGTQQSTQQAGLPTITFPTLPPATAASTQAPTQAPTTNSQPVPTSYCDWAAYVKDVTVPDGTIFAPGTQFTKTWRLQNVGTCSWTKSYALIFTSGAHMSAPAVVALTSNVNPGQTVDVSVDLAAPAAEGTYQGYWMLRNASGTLFGLGSSARDPFYVDIKVVGGMTTMVDMAERYCEADWVSGAGDLHCGYTNEKKGYAMLVDKPQLENGHKTSGLGLLMVPENVNNGYLKGIYQSSPFPFLVQKGDRFRAIINCEYQSNGCNVTFRLDYQLGNSQPQTIWQFNEAYEGQYYTVDTDLSPLAGNQVKFILTVLANGSPANDRAMWIAPRIDRPTNFVTPSVTPTVTATATSTSTGVPPTSTTTSTATATVTSVPNTATPTPTATGTATPTITPTP